MTSKSSNIGVGIVDKVFENGQNTSFDSIGKRKENRTFFWRIDDLTSMKVNAVLKRQEERPNGLERTNRVNCTERINREAKEKKKRKTM